MENPNYVNFGSTLKTKNRLFQPYFKPTVEPPESKASKDVLNTKNPERHVDKLLHPIKEKLSSAPSPETPVSTKRKKSILKKQKKPPTVKKRKTTFSIFDGYHT